MLIKKRKRNRYAHAGDNLWVRDYASPAYEDINDLVGPEDVRLMTDNEVANMALSPQPLATFTARHEDVIVVNAGAGFDGGASVESAPEAAAVVAVGAALADWRAKRRPTYYVVNNPYRECLEYLPRGALWPRCVASVRTNPAFLRAYQGLRYYYVPTPSRNFGGLRWPSPGHLDDYRNPLCAALGLAHRFGVRRLLLVAPDRGSTERLEGMVEANGQYYYPAQLTAARLVDACCFWLREGGVTVGVISGGPVYAHAQYITPEEVPAFFASGHGQRDARVFTEFQRVDGQAARG